jgi:sulfur carrier protein
MRSARKFPDGNRRPAAEQRRNAGNDTLPFTRSPNCIMLSEKDAFLRDNAMKLHINGEEIVTAEGVTLLELLEQRDIKPRTVVVERNLAPVDRKDFAVTRLEPGDKLEILHFVGGG